MGVLIIMNLFFTQRGGEWGAKASADMIVTRGKGFRHEKTKKKRGSYRGGKIDDMAIRSFKFDD